MQAPVRKRKATTDGEVGSTRRMAAFAAVATSAEIMKKRRGSSRSARPPKALARVPKTKPACTLLVKSDA